MLAPRSIQCQLTGSDTAQAGDLIARGHSPVFDLCRFARRCRIRPQVAHGVLQGRLPCPSSSLDRGGAGFTLRETVTDGPRVVRWKPFPGCAVRAPVELNGLDVAEDACAVPDHAGSE
jgi:hypothetical protein